MSAPAITFDDDPATATPIFFAPMNPREVSIPVTVNVARSVEEAEKQARGEAISRAGDEDDVEEEDEYLDPSEAPQPNV